MGIAYSMQYNRHIEIIDEEMMLCKKKQANLNCISAYMPTCIFKI